MKKKKMKKNAQTTVNLTAEGQEIKDQLSPSLPLKYLLSAGLYLFDGLEPEKKIEHIKRQAEKDGIEERLSAFQRWYLAQTDATKSIVKKRLYSLFEFNADNIGKITYNIHDDDETLAKKVVESAAIESGLLTKKKPGNPSKSGKSF
jgi:hypothetical protein